MKTPKKTVLIPYHPPAPKTNRKNKAGKLDPGKTFVSPENLMLAYAQMHKLEEMVQQHIPILECGIVERDQEIKKLKVLSKLKDEELQRLRIQ